MSPKNDPQASDGAVSIPVRKTTNDQANSELINMEMEHNIPVRQFDRPNDSPQKGQQPNPIVEGTKKPAEKTPEDEDKELEHVLKDVNQKVKDADQEDKSKSGKKFLGKVKKTKAPKESSGAKKPLLTTLAAILVAGGLAATAVYAFNQDEAAKLQPTSSSSGVKTPQTNTNQATTAELNSTSSALDSELNSLNDNQEFNADELSDKNLGLQ